MRSTELYNLALANIGNNEGRYGTARHSLTDGSVLICSVNSVAGCSIVERHNRTTWHLVPSGQQYSKQVSQKRAASLLKDNH